MRKLSAQLFSRSACRAVRLVASETPTDAVQHGADHQDVAAGSDRTRLRSADAAGVKRRSGSVSRRTPDGSVSRKILVTHSYQVICCQSSAYGSLDASHITNGNPRHHWSRLRTAHITARSSPAAVQRQQLAQNFVVGDVRRPTVRSSHSRVKSLVRIGEPLRPGVVEVRQRALLERLSPRPRRAEPAASDSREPARPATRPTRAGSTTGRATRPAVELPRVFSIVVAVSGTTYRALATRPIDTRAPSSPCAISA